ncbi:hypothetical protein, partial [Cupriavidus basilensis]|uniref:hypothetical protein n=1 Tax=Cupriavidus basilensis TaxID=68895 RepID=UPI0023E88B83
CGIGSAGFCLRGAILPVDTEVGVGVELAFVRKSHTVLRCVGYRSLFLLARRQRNSERQDDPTGARALQFGFLCIGVGSRHQAGILSPVRVVI